MAFNYYGNYMQGYESNYRVLIIILLLLLIEEYYVIEEESIRERLWIVVS